MPVKSYLPEVNDHWFSFDCWRSLGARHASGRSVKRLGRRCWTRLAKRAGRNFRSSSFSSDRRRANIYSRWRWCGNTIAGSLSFDGERILEWHILTKYFAGRLTAVDVFYSIHKAAIFNAEQLILGITASRYVESLRLKGKLFPFLTSSNSILSHEIELNFGTFFLRCLDLCMKYIGISFDAKRASEEKGWIIRRPRQLTNVLSLKTCVKLDQPSFARCMFLLIKRNYQ